MTTGPWVYSPIFAIDHYSTSSTLHSIEEFEFHIRSSNASYANKRCAVCLSLLFPTSPQPGGPPGLPGPCARTKTQAKSEQTPCGGFLSPRRRQNDTRAHVHAAAAGHVLGNVSEKDTQKAPAPFPAGAIFRFQRHRRPRSLKGCDLWQLLLFP